MRAPVVAVVASASVVSLLAAQGQQQRPVFQAGTDTVVLDIAVRQNGAPVLGLKQDDFQVFDNGVRQTVDHMTAESFPLDLTLLIDETGYGQAVLDQITTSVSTATDMLADDDHLRVVTFNAAIQQRYEGPAATLGPSLENLEAKGRSSVFDAVVAALARKRNPERRSVAIAFTTGIDTTSTTAPAKLLEVARRSDVLFDVFLAYRPDAEQQQAPSDPSAAISTSATPSTPPVLAPTVRRIGNEQYLTHLKAAAEATGGFVQEMLGDAQVTKALTTALADYRARYVLFYTIKGTARTGWHDLKVTVKGHDTKGANEYQVMARKGYDGGK